MGNVSLQFLAFALITVLIYQLFRSMLWHQLVLLAASCYFLSSFSHDPRAFLPLAGFLALGYLSLQFVDPGRRWAFPLTVVVTILCFVWLKKYAFLPDRLFLSFPYLTVGLSYILFRTLHLIIDRHSGVLKENVNPFQFALYMVNFTTLVSGPIQHFPEFREMLQSPSPVRPSLKVIGVAIERIVIGVFKVNVLALAFSDLQASAISRLSEAASAQGHVVAACLIFASYPFFLYCNFSGYIDIVIGIASLLGISLPENFNRPFSSDSFIEFWSRWHITLSNWLKTYVYNPLLMTLMRNFPAPRLEPAWAVLSFFVTFFLIGVWHGQTTSFLFFGFLQGLGVSVNKLYQILVTRAIGRKGYRALSGNPIYIAFSRGLTFSWFAFSLIWFWSYWSQVHALFAAIGLRDALAVWLVIWSASAVLLAGWEILRNAVLSIHIGGCPVLYSRYWRTAWVTALFLIALGVVMLSGRPAPEMVYKTF
jgi:alginate O-acetyltransferase complex protein AlgI